MPDSTSLPPSSGTNVASGSGTTELSLNWGRNTNRASKCYRYSFSNSNSNTLTVYQNGAALSIAANGITTPSVVAGSGTLTLTGTANGEYFKFVSNNLTVNSCQVSYGSSPQNISQNNTYTKVTSFNGEAYSYSITVAIPNTISEDTYFDVLLYAADDSSGISQQSVNYRVEVTVEEQTNVTVTLPHSMTIIEGESVEITATVLPVSESNYISWSVSAADSEYISVTPNQSYPNKATIEGLSETPTNFDAPVFATYTKNTNIRDDCFITVAPAAVITVSDKSVGGSFTDTQVSFSASNVSSLSAFVVNASQVSWITECSVNSSSSTPYVYVRFYGQNNSGSDRTATIGITGFDRAGNQVSPVYFDLTHEQKSEWDIPCDTMTINGTDTIDNSNNVSGTYTVSYGPPGCTQTGCTWELASGDDAYVSLDDTVPGGCQLTVLSAAGTSGRNITLIAKNIHTDSQGHPVRQTSKTISVVYNTSDGYISVDTASVLVGCNDTYNTEPVITLVNMREESVVFPTQLMTGFIDDAYITTIGGVKRIKTEFTANPNTTERTGEISVQGIDEGGITRGPVVIQYRQGGQPSQSDSIAVTSATLYQNGPKLGLTFALMYTHHGTSSREFPSISYEVTGYRDSISSSNIETGPHYGSDNNTPNVTTSLTQTYSTDWRATLGMTNIAVLTVYCGEMETSTDNVTISQVLPDE